MRLRYRLSSLLVLFFLGVFGPAQAQVAPSSPAAPDRGPEAIRFARMPDISPDGKSIAFSYMGDIWIVDSSGGMARMLTSHEAHETSPAFSPDGKWLAFSSNRHGGYDLFVVPVQGGRPRRLTFDSAAEMANGWTPDGKRILFTSRRGTSFPSVSVLYTISVEGGREEKVSAYEGRDGSYSPKGDRIAFAQGPGTWYRKGYRGSANDDIWTSKADGSENRQITDFLGQDGSPMWSADGKHLYYVSEHFGTANLCRIPADGSRSPLQISKHTEDSVRRARINATGEWIVYECGGDLWLCHTQGEPQCHKLSIEAYADDRNNPERTETYTQGITEYALSPNQDHVAFVVHGEIFLMPIGGGKAQRLTNHPGHDRDLAWSPDMKQLIFVSDRNGRENIYSLEQNDPEHPELVKAHVFKVTQLTTGSEPDANTTFSPDGKAIGFVRGGKLWTMKPDGTDQKVLVDQTRIIEYSWSPDSKWVVYSRMDANFASELYAIPVAGGTPINMTRYATRNFGISWSSDGKKLAFVSQRRQDLDVFVMSLQKPVAEGSTAKVEGIDFEDIHLRVQRCTSLSSEESEVSLRPDGTLVAFRSNSLNSDDLWIASSSGTQVLRLTTGSLRPNQIRWSKGGTMVYFLDGNGALRYARVASALLSGSTATESAPVRIAFTAKMKISRDEEFAQMFEEAWRKLATRFYDPKHHGADWITVRLKYQPLVKHVVMQEDFYDLISLMLGELNASHLGISGQGRTPEETTAELGLIWDESHRGPGLKIAEILRRGPADQRGLDLKVGQYVMAIDGKELNDQVNLSALLNDKAGEVVILQVATDPRSPMRKKIELRPTSRTTVANLMYQRWVAGNVKRVHDLSGGKFGYIHIKSMDAESLDEFVRTLYSDNFDKEAILLDVRYNGGGFTHDQVLNYLGGKEHTLFITRDGEKGPVLRANDRKWTRPVVLLCNNRSYSDAEIFPQAFRDLGLGKLVGETTGGFVIGTVEERLIDGSRFRIPRLGVFTVAGVNMEKSGVVPDVIVEQHPDQLAKGLDAQLDKAVDVLAKEVEAKKAKKPEIVNVPKPLPIPAVTPESGMK
jgi:tricorn protease